MFANALGVVTGVCATYVYLANSVKQTGYDTRLERHQGLSDLVNPLLECNPPARFPAYEFSPFESDLKALIDRLSGSGQVNQLSVYFRDLNNGPWFGVNEDEVLKPGSLLKVPMMIGYLKRAEQDPSILRRQVLFENASLRDYYRLQGIRPEVELELGRKYTVLQLLERMIIHSDNVAAVLLEDLDKKESILKAATDLDIPVRDGYPPFRNLTIKEYSGFFRVLYNGSYLSRENSSRALGWLAQSRFRAGLVAGVSGGVTVAHKFGEAVETNREQVYFHDCGIVYLPQKPYLLCATARGKDSRPLIEAIREISSFVHTKVTER